MRCWTYCKLACGSPGCRLNRQCPRRAVERLCLNHFDLSVDARRVTVSRLRRRGLGFSPQAPVPVTPVCGAARRKQRAAFGNVVSTLNIPTKTNRQHRYQHPDTGAPGLHIAYLAGRDKHLGKRQKLAAIGYTNRSGPRLWLEWTISTMAERSISSVSSTAMRRGNGAAPVATQSEPRPGPPPADSLPDELQIPPGKGVRRASHCSNTTR